MSVAREVLNGVTFDTGREYVAEHAIFNAEYGFLELESCRSTGNMGSLTNFIGFGVSGWQVGTSEVAEEIIPVTELADLPIDTQHIDRVGKGVGPRLYSAPQALGGTAENPTTIGVYQVRIDKHAIHETRGPWSPSNIAGQGMRKAVHLYHKLAVEIEGLDEVVGKVHRSQHGADISMHHQTPAALRLRKERQLPPSPVEESFMIIRNPHLYVPRIGTFQRQAQ